jgi:hypothetical protein
MPKRKADVDVGLPVPLGDYSYLPPVQTGMNDAVEEKAMNPILSWLAGQGIDVVAEQTGIKDIFRERGTGLLKMFGIDNAEAANVQDKTPVQTGFEPTTSVIAQDVTPAQRSAMNYVPDSQIPMEGRRLPTGSQILVRQDWEGQGRGPAGGVTGNQDGVRQLSPISKWAMDDNTPPASDAEVDEVIKKSDPDSLLGRLWDSTLGDEEWRLRKAMILNSMRLNPDAALTQAFASRIKDLRAKKGSGRTAQWLRSQGYNKYADLVEEYPEMAKDVVSAVVSASVKAPTAAESKIARIEELGFTRDQAIRISDLTDIILDPDTKTPILVDKATGRRVAPMTPRADMAPPAPAAAPQQQPQMPPSGPQFQQRQLPQGVVIESPAQTLERADIVGALGVPGFISEAINLPFELIGADRPMDEQARARTFMQDLTSETMLAFASAFPGRPGNLTREKIEDMTVKADDLAQGPQKALDKQGNLLRTMYNAMESAKYIAESGEGYSPTQRNEAREKYNELVPLFDKHVALYRKLEEAQKGRGAGAKGPRGPVISPEVGSLLQKPEYQ